MSDLVKLYNPANAAALTPEQLEGLRKLTSAEIKELALAYPNMTMQRAYLLIVDGSKAVEKQLANLSSFENLWNLREKNGQRNYVAIGFRGTYKASNQQPVKAKRTEVVDLSDTELMSLPGFKKLESVPKVSESIKEDVKENIEQVKVTKIRKVPTAKSKGKTKN